MSQSDPTTFRCWAEIDLAGLERNLKSIQSTLPKRIRYIAVVKADAYGHGMQQTVARLMQAGVDMFAVANVAEASTIREIGAGWPIIIVLGATLKEEESQLFEYDLIPTISTVEELGRLDARATRENANLKAHMKIDTGMGRLGIWHEYADELFQAFRDASRVSLHGIYTHFASADDDPEFTRRQRKIFIDTIARADWLPVESLLIHADNSAGISTFAPTASTTRLESAYCNSGSALIPNPCSATRKQRQFSNSKSRVGITKTLPKGASISYGRSHILNGKAALPSFARYGDGVPLQLSNRGEVIIHQQRCPILGRVTMDQTIVDVTEIDQTVASGDLVTIIGRQGDAEIRLEEFSEWADSIPWEVLCSVTKRVPRIYKTAIQSG